MLKKSGLVAAILTAGLLLGAPLASATEPYPPKDDHKGDDKGSSVVDNRGCNGGNGVGNISCNPIGVEVTGPLAELPDLPL